MLHISGSHSMLASTPATVSSSFGRWKLPQTISVGCRPRSTPELAPWMPLQFAYLDNGKENGNYRDYRGYIGVIYWDNGK